MPPSQISTPEKKADQTLISTQTADTMAAPDYQALGIDVTVIPGTEHLIDLEGTVKTKHDKKTKDIVLVPAPSADPEDPLNWSPRRKAVQMVGLAVYVISRNPFLASH